jgi:hypothetical protein
MGQTSDPKTLVIHQKMTLGNNPEDFKQQWDRLIGKLYKAYVQML